MLAQEFYTDDKPQNCRVCYFWGGRYTGCTLDKCYYLKPPEETVESDCVGCPYGRDHPCIGWCTKKIMRELGIN